MTSTPQQEQLVADRLLEAPPSAVFALLSDPARHQDTEPGE